MNSFSWRAHRNWGNCSYNDCSFNFLPREIGVAFYWDLGGGGNTMQDWRPSGAHDWKQWTEKETAGDCPSICDAVAPAPAAPPDLWIEIETPNLPRTVYREAKFGSNVAIVLRHATYKETLQTSLSLRRIHRFPMLQSDGLNANPRNQDTTCRHRGVVQSDWGLYTRRKLPRCLTSRLEDEIIVEVCNGAVYTL